MAKTQSLEEHLTAVRDELKAASQKADSEAKTRINAALEHAQMARTELKAQIATANPKAKQSADQTMQHLDDVAKNAQKSVAETGEVLHKRVDSMLASAKSAIESAKSAAK